MHRLTRDYLEDVLQGTLRAGHPALEHLASCDPCAEQVEAMREQRKLLAALRVRPETELEPRPGFYARVMDRIEAQGPASIWSLVFDSVYGRRIAFASVGLVVLIGFYLVSAETVSAPELAQDAPIEIMQTPIPQGQFVTMHDQPGIMAPGGFDQDSVLVNLVTYREQ
jgi:hypothetical protein